MPCPQRHKTALGTTAARQTYRMKDLLLTGIAALFLATGAAHAAAERPMVPAICFTEIPAQNAMKICGDLSNCVDRPGECEAIERDREAHVKAGRLRCVNEKNCKFRQALTPRKTTFGIV